MRNKAIYILLLALFACEKEEVGQLDCASFKTAIVNENEALIRSEIEKLTPDLPPAPTPEDNIGHMINLNTLVDRMNSDCNDINTNIRCYACLKTYPLGSEIMLEFTYENIPISKTIVIVTSEDDILRYGGIHETH